MEALIPTLFKPLKNSATCFYTKTLLYAYRLSLCATDNFLSKNRPFSNTEQNRLLFVMKQQYASHAARQLKFKL